MGSVASGVAHGAVRGAVGAAHVVHAGHCLTTLGMGLGCRGGGRKTRRARGKKGKKARGTRRR